MYKPWREPVIKRLMHNHQAQDTETVCEEEAGGDRTEKESIADATGGIHA